MSRSLLRRVTALALTALILAAHLPLPAGAAMAGRHGAASKLACCAPKACCQPDRACATGGCGSHGDHPAMQPDRTHARAPIDRTLPTLLAGNCGDPTPRVVPVSFDPVTPPSRTDVRAAVWAASLSARPATNLPARNLTPSVPPPRA